MKKFLFYINQHYLWFFPLIWVLILTPLTPLLDMKIERYFYGNNEFYNNFFFQWMYDYGPWFSLAFSFFMFVLVFSKKMRKPALMLLLSFALGSGLLVHLLLKDHWGRPRPKQLEEFGGTQKFRPYYCPNFEEKIPSKSFPCGHCSTGFYFLAISVLGIRLKKIELTILGLILGLGLGIALSITRLAQGGHFFSDALLSALIMWLVALFSDWFIFEFTNSYSK